MSKKLSSQISSAIISFFSALRLYPPGHPTVKGSLNNFMNLIRPIIFEKNHLLIRFYEGLIVVEGEPSYDLASQSEEICSFFEEKKIEGIELRRGINESEIREVFKTLLSMDDTYVGMDSINSLLSQRGIKSIHIVSFKKKEDLEERARRVYGEAKKYVVEIMKATSQGKSIGKGDKAIEMMEEVNSILDEDYNAVIPLVILQDYDEYTFNHTVNVGILSLALAKAMELPSRKAIATGVGGMLHDIGKAKIPKNIILKTSRLTREEWEILKKHPVLGAKIAQEMKSLDPYTLKVIYQHHVGYSMKGYPELKNPSELVKGSLIVATCDNYDAMTTQRPYQKRFDPSEALEIMRRKVGDMLDPVIFSRFVYILGKYPIGSIVRLSTGEVGIVSRLNLKNPDLPTVKVIMDATGSKIERPFEVDTSLVDANPDRISRYIIGPADPLTKALVDVAHYINI